VSSLLLHHQINVTDFFHLGPSQSKFLPTPVNMERLILPYW